MNPETLPGTTDRRVAGLLRLLAQNATIVISGARIAREIGVSRSTVWRWVERLREMGVKVKGQAATGYFLEKVPEILTPTVLKWPNDLMIRGKKTGGILTEMHAEPGMVRFVVVGIGLNVNQERFPGELAGLATSLRQETGKTHSRMELLVRLLREFESDYNRFLREGIAGVIQRFAVVSSYAHGKKVRVTSGTESYVGTTAGLGPEGLLQVEREDGRVVTVIAGDVAEAR